MSKETVKKKNYFKRIYPQSKADFKMYFSMTWPIVIGEILFCINGFLDNFMVSHIPSGIDALTYANTYTNIIYTIFFAIQGIASMFVGQYYGKKDFDKVKQIINLRIFIFLIIALPFALSAWIAPDSMIYLMGGNKVKDAVISEGRMYLMFIAISWVIIAFNFNTNMQLNETGHSNLAFISATLTLVSNASVNAILLYGFKGNAYYAAFGTIASAIVCITSDSLLTYYKDRAIFFNPFKIFHIKKAIAIQILRRIPAMLITIAAMITVPIRMIIWSRGFPDDLLHGSGVGHFWMGIGAVTILGLVESLAAIASAITSACSTNVSYFVAGNLGRDNFEEAEKHAYALRGFHAFFGFCLSIIMLGVVLILAYSKTTTKGAQDSIIKNLDFYYKQKNAAQLFNYIYDDQKGLIDTTIIKNAKASIYTFGFDKSPAQFNEFLINSNNLEISKWIAEMKNQIGIVFKRVFLYSCLSFVLFNPIWCWFYTAAALPRAGGRNIIGSLTILGAFWSSFIWLNILIFGISQPYHLSLELTYFLFYSFDIVRFIIFEIIAWKTNWKRNITVEIEHIHKKLSDKKISA
ncbi:MATE family efflux transporter [Metamycoplasma auris]|uniref:Probable multidrug resistance protein NorM n=1 Tax=Metamycoplasma auris TaxID=51363 RepID=A0A2W7G6H3_9BACT|nr:MATE family efflux transporter [Metamycoplasma auris]PZW01534.1 Na+-driven multidrug efflux pump [Metamycoplasma auris]